MVSHRQIAIDPEFASAKAGRGPCHIFRQVVDKGCVHALLCQLEILLNQGLFDAARNVITLAELDLTNRDDYKPHYSNSSPVASLIGLSGRTANILDEMQIFTLKQLEDLSAGLLMERDNVGDVCVGQVLKCLENLGRKDCLFYKTGKVLLDLRK